MQFSPSHMLERSVGIMNGYDKFLGGAVFLFFNGGGEDADLQSKRTQLPLRKALLFAYGQIFQFLLNSFRQLY